MSQDTDINVEEIDQQREQQRAIKAIKEAETSPNISELINIVPFIEQMGNKYPSYYSKTEKTGAEFLEELGQVVCEEYEIDEDSRKQWVEKAVTGLKLLKAYMNPKSWPWENCSNVHLPIITTAVIQFQARAYDALIGAKGAVQIINTELANMLTPEQIKQKRARADRVEKHMNYQLLYEMEEFEDDLDAMLIELPTIGCTFKKTYYDQVLNRPVSAFVSGLDVVFNYGAKNVESAQRISHIFDLYENDIRKKVHAGVYAESAWDLGSGSGTIQRKSNLSVLDDIDGKNRQATGTNLPRLIIEQHRYVDLNNDGIGEPVVVTVDYESKKVLRITSREKTDAIGRPITVEYFTQFNFFPNPTGGYGIGFNMLMGGINEAAITILNEVIDAGTLANLQGGFIAKRSGMKKGSLTFSMGEYKEVDTYVDDIRKAIMPLEYKGPNQTLYAVLGLLYEYSKLVSSISETMTGQLPASDTPAHTVLALIEEGRKVFSTIHKRIHRAFKKELKKLFRVNSVYLNPDLYFYILGANNIPTDVKMQIAKADYTDTFDVLPVSDPAIMSRAEKMIRAQQVRELVLTDPISSKNPDAIFAATRRFLETVDPFAVDEVYPRPQPKQPQDVPPAMENAGFLIETEGAVLPQQDHQQHLQVHDELVSGPFAPNLTPKGKRILDAHRQQHIAGLYINDKMQETGGIQ